MRARIFVCQWLQRVELSISLGVSHITDKKQDVDVDLRHAHTKTDDNKQNKDNYWLLGL